MIDVTFLLLVFFMCTLRFKTLEGVLAADLPKDVGVGSTPALSEERVEVRIEVVQPGTRVRPDGSPYTAADEAAGRRFEYDATRVVRYTVGPRATTDVAELSRMLVGLRKALVSSTARVDARPGVTHGEAVGVVDALQGAGFVEATFVGSHEP